MLVSTDPKIIKYYYAPDSEITLFIPVQFQAVTREMPYISHSKSDCLLYREKSVWIYGDL